MSQKCQHARDLWSQLDALRLGMNYTKEDVNKLQVLVDDCYGESHPGSFHLNHLGDEAVLIASRTNCPVAMSAAGSVAVRKFGTSVRIPHLRNAYSTHTRTSAEQSVSTGMSALEGSKLNCLT